MNKIDIQKAFDKINPTDEQKTRMLNNILSSQSKTVVHKFKFVPVVASLAAVMMIAAGIYTYRVINVEKKPEGNTVIKNIEHKTSEGEVIMSQRLQCPETPSKDRNETKEFSQDIAISKDDAIQNEYNTPMPEIRASKEEAVEAIDTDSAEAFVVNEGVIPPGASSNMLMMAKVSSGGSSGAVAADVEEVEEEPVYKEYTASEYFDYLGDDFTSALVLPDDFSVSEPESKIFEMDSEGKIADDKWYFTFQGKDERFVSVLTSKDTASVKRIIEDPQYSVSAVNCADAAIFLNDGMYSVYMINNDISYQIDTFNITEDEMKEIIKSITK